MAMNISGFGAGSNSAYKSINTNSKQYKAAAKDHLAALMEEEAMMTTEQKMLYELLGGREAHMRNVMQNYNSDGDFIGPGGCCGSRNVSWGRMEKLTALHGSS